MRGIRLCSVQVAKDHQPSLPILCRQVVDALLVLTCQMASDLGVSRDTDKNKQTSDALIRYHYVCLCPPEMQALVGCLMLHMPQAILLELSICLAKSNGMQHTSALPDVVGRMEVTIWLTASSVASQDMVVGLDASWPDLDSNGNNLIGGREMTLSLAINFIRSCRVVVSCMRHVESVVGNWSTVTGVVMLAYVGSTGMQKCSATAHSISRHFINNLAFVKVQLSILPNNA